jgi:hypothetical protein
VRGELGLDELLEVVRVPDFSPPARRGGTQRPRSVASTLTRRRTATANTHASSTRGPSDVRVEEQRQWVSQFRALLELENKTVPAEIEAESPRTRRRRSSNWRSSKPASSTRPASPPRTAGGSPNCRTLTPPDSLPRSRRPCAASLGSERICTASTKSATARRVPSELVTRRLRPLADDGSARTDWLTPHFSSAVASRTVPASTHGRRKRPCGRRGRCGKGRGAPESEWTRSPREHAAVET